MTETFYDLLGVPTDATSAEIEEAYRENVKQVHPDVNDEVDAADRTKRLNEAKRVLTDETEREKYDRLGHQQYTNAGPNGSGGGRSTAGGSAATASTDGGRRTTGRGESGSATATATGGASTDGDWWNTRSSGGGSTGGSGPSRSSSGPAWQSGSGTASATGATAESASAAGAAGKSTSARRQAAAGRTGDPSVGWSWNGWERTRSWAVRDSTATPRGFHPGRLFPGNQSFALLASTLLLYPFFVVTVFYPPFPVVARAAVGVCTLLMFAYLLSVPEVAVVVYGVWSLVIPTVIVVVEGISLFSLVGVVGLGVTWLPLGLSVLTLTAIEP